MDIESIITATATNPDMRTAIESINSGVWPKHHPFYSVRDELSVTSNRLVLRGAILVMPKAFRNETLKHAHNGHQGINKLCAQKFGGPISIKT